jgi:hypothetical protein
LVSVVVGHYWIGFGEGRIGFGLVFRGPGALLDWIHFEGGQTFLINLKSKKENPFQGVDQVQHSVQC